MRLAARALFFLALLFAAPAAAQSVSGPQADYRSNPVPATWGAGTPRQFGGLAPTDIGCPAGTTLTSTSLSYQAVHNSTAVSIWQSDTTHNVIDLPGTSGTLPPSIAASTYDLVVSAPSCSRLLKLAIVPARVDVRLLSTDTSSGGGSNSVPQLTTLLQSSTLLAGGDTIMVRDGVAANVTDGSTWTIKPVSGGWIWNGLGSPSTRVTIQPEHPTTTLDPANGQVAAGGAAELGPIQWQDPTGVTDADWQVDWVHMHRLENFAGLVGTPGLPTYLLNASAGYDWTDTYDLVEVGPNVLNWSDMAGVQWNYRGCFTAPTALSTCTNTNMAAQVPSASSPCGGTQATPTACMVVYDHNRANLLGIGFQALNVSTATMAGQPPVAVHAYWMVCSGISNTDCLDLMPTSYTDVEYTFCFGFHATRDGHADCVQTWPSARAPATPDGAGTWRYNISTRGLNNTLCCQAGLPNAQITIVNGGAHYAPEGPTTAVNAQGGTGCMGVPVDVGVTGGVITSAMFSKNAEAVGWGCQSGDVLYLTQANSQHWFASSTCTAVPDPNCATLQIGMASALGGYPTDNQGPPFINVKLPSQTLDTFNGALVDHNTYVGTYENAIVMNATANPTAPNNTSLFDISTNANRPFPTTTFVTVKQGAVGDQSTNPGAGGDLSHNLTTGFIANWTAPAAATNCAPFTCAVNGGTATAIAATALAYGKALPNFGVLPWTSRANTIFNVTPSPTAWNSGATGGAVLSDGTVMGALWPADHLGQVCWALEGVAFDQTKNCVTDLGSTIAQ